MSQSKNRQNRKNEDKAIELDARMVLQIIEQTHPDVVQAAMWQLRARIAEDQVEALTAALQQQATQEPTPTEDQPAQEADGPAE